MNRKLRPRIGVLAQINKMLEEVEHAMHSREKMEVTALFSFLSVLYTLFHWWLTEVVNVDDDLVTRWHNRGASSGST